MNRSHPRIRDALRDAERLLVAAGIGEAAVDARRLLAHALRTDRAGLIAGAGEPVPSEAREIFEAMLGRRMRREPVARILGRREFRGLMLEVTPDVLDPRPETELLVDQVLAHAPSRPFRFVDVGTGSGAIAIAILAERADASGIGCDLSPAALEIATRNARAAGVADRFEPMHSDFLAAVPPGRDVIVSNPPYIPAAIIETLDPEVRLHDPRMALDGGADGLDAYRAIIGAAASRLVEGGFLHLELGIDQAEAVCGIARGNDFHIECVVPDLAGVPRVVTARRKAG